MGNWPPLCIHNLEVGYCAVCNETHTDEICQCYALYAAVGQTRPKFVNGVCSRCGLVGPPVGHTGQHGATCGRCYGYDRKQIHKTKVVTEWMTKK